MDHLEILPISKAPVRKGEVDLRPVLLALTSRGGWTIGAWNGSAWFDVCNGRVVRRGSASRCRGCAREADDLARGVVRCRGYQAALAARWGAINARGERGPG